MLQWRGLFQKLLAAQHSHFTPMSDCEGMFSFSCSMVWCVCFPLRHTFLPSGSMKITETRISDSGMYLCVATNIAGNVTQSVKLSVHGEYWKATGCLCPLAHSEACVMVNIYVVCRLTREFWTIRMWFSFISSDEFVASLQITPPFSIFKWN